MYFYVLILSMGYLSTNSNFTLYCMINIVLMMFLRIININNAVKWTFWLILTIRQSLEILFRPRAPFLIYQSYQPFFQTL